MNKTIIIRVPEGVHAAIKAAALREDRSISKWMTRLAIKASQEVK
jgi:predicted HicB family RNase H-like nuclease